MDLSKLRIMNAAGWCKNVDTVRELARTPVHEITLGSITFDPKPGNEGSTFWQSPDGVYALNSLGLPNRGLDAYEKIMPEIQSIARKENKKLRVSIAGFSKSEYAHLALGVAHHADVVELNLGCPNIWGEDGQKPIAAFNLELTNAILNAVEGALLTMGNDRPRIAIKLSPYSDPTQLDAMIRLIVQKRLFVDEVVTSNTFPNAFAFNGEKSAITPGGGFAGLSGNAMKGIALGQAKRLHDGLHHHGITITGVGGITTGADIIDFLRCGIESVQIGTHYFLNDEKVFSELLQEAFEFV